MTETDSPKTLWEADSTHPDLAETLRAGLREVVDPELGLNIIELGLIREAVVNPENDLLIKMILTTPFCPYGPAMLDMTRKKASEITGLDATIEIGMEMWDPSMMEEGTGAEWGLF